MADHYIRNPGQATIIAYNDREEPAPLIERAEPAETVSFIPHGDKGVQVILRAGEVAISVEFSHDEMWFYAGVMLGTGTHAKGPIGILEER